MILAVLPEILLVVLGAVVLLVDLALPAERKTNLGWVTAVGLVLIMVVSLLAGLPGVQPQTLWGGMVRHDWLGFVFKMMFLIAAAITALFAMDLPQAGRRGEFYLLMIASTIGMCVMASASDITLLYLGIETTSIPLYVLAGFLVRDDKSTEAGFKYLLFGALTSTVMLYGFSLLYGFTGL